MAAVGADARHEIADAIAHSRRAHQQSRSAGETEWRSRLGMETRGGIPTMPASDESFVNDNDKRRRDAPISPQP
ncbi:hypothetical protein OsJ_18417 [Oryza sativa Japonica Group]|uniref:Uncharacterized protein n=1 Tax=Oryza sativa subsp. japonica TaxID=39947 RepID=B9FI30_ORYSJ|nr:hypothetical protein OsJ_18417 [Oryza sativa Japonica Group]